MKVLVVAQHDNHTLKPVSFNAIAAGLKLSMPLEVVVAGNNCTAVAEQASYVEGVEKVILAEGEEYKNHLAENLALLIKQIANDYTHILAPATTFGKNFMPRAAALLDVSQISDVIKIIDQQTFVRPIYAGNAIETLSSVDKFKILTIRAINFGQAKIGQGQAPIARISANNHFKATQFVKTLSNESEHIELTDAKIIVSGGRGLKDAKNFQLVDKLAACLNAAVGATRAAVDAGFAPNDYQIGQTGKIVAPELYIAVGISGAIQHIAGMKDSKVIVAINQDEQAPIFDIATYGLVGDLFTLVPALIAAMDKLKASS